MVGKLIVATEESELGRLNDLYERGQQQRHRRISSCSTRGRSRNANRIAAACKAIFSPVTGIVDWGRGRARTTPTTCASAGGDMYLGREVIGDRARAAASRALHSTRRRRRSARRHHVRRPLLRQARRR